MKYNEVTFNSGVYLKIGKSTDFFEGKGKRISVTDDVDSEIAVFRLKGKLYALSNICPHRHQDQIYNGLIEKDNVICPLHGWTYSVETGENVNQRQGVKNLRKFEIFEERGLVYLEKPEIKQAAWKYYNEPSE